MLEARFVRMAYGNSYVKEGKSIAYGAQIEEAGDQKGGTQFIGSIVQHFLCDEKLGESILLFLLKSTILSCNLASFDY